ncbi:MAG TPA: YhgE/Pip domain-containing protein [Galbitalea sp.]|jgi:putative membrane protein
MKIVPLVRTEAARLTSSRLGIASLVALMVVPIIYGGLYLWGNQDPYNNLGNVPAAIVVGDAGATLDGAHVNYGRDAAKNLVDGKKFGWHIVSASAAKKGVTKGTYDFSVTFPSSFSSDLTSAATTTPTKARLELTTNDINSYLSTTLAKQATAAVQTAITQEVAQAGTHKLLNAVSSLRGGLVDARAGSSELADGSKQAATGAATLSNGLSELKSRTASLPSSTARLSSGAAQVATGAGALKSGLTTLDSGMAQYRAQLAMALAASGLPAANQQALLAGYDKLAAGERSAKSGAADLSTGATQVATGTGQLAANTPTLANGISQAATGAASLKTGATSLSAGAHQLDSSLAAGLLKVPATSAAERVASAKTLADPVVVSQHAITEAQNYGAGLAPFFISLSAWIGIYALFLIVRPLSRRALTAVRRPIRTTLAGWITPAILGIVQMIALYAILTLALHLRIADPAGLLLFMGFVSITFAAIVLALNALLGSVGQFLGLILMIVQLVTAGGTFPYQTLPGPLRVLHQALPMSHAVDGVRQLMYGGTAGDLASAITPLLLWLVAALAVTVLAALRQGRTRSLTQLRPSAIGG